MIPNVVVEAQRESSVTRTEVCEVILLDSQDDDANAS